MANGSDGRFSEAQKPHPRRVEAVSPVDEEGTNGLAPVARKNQLTWARATLIISGVLTVVVSIVFAYLLDHEIKANFGRSAAGGLPAEAAATLRRGNLSYGTFFVIGFVFIFLGAFVWAHPLFCTVTAFVLYLAGIVVLARIGPEMWLGGFVAKIVIVVPALVMAMLSALSSPRDAISK